MRILLAEDNQEIRSYITKIFNIWGYNFDVVEDGLEVIEKLKQNSYDVILMDINMPKMSGIQAAKQIIKENTVPPKIIIMTGHAIKMSDIEGIDSILSKPFTLNQFKEALSAVTNLKQ